MPLKISVSLCLPVRVFPSILSGTNEFTKSPWGPGTSPFFKHKSQFSAKSETKKFFTHFFTFFTSENLNRIFFQIFFAKSENSKIPHIYLSWITTEPIFSEIGDKKILHFFFSLHFSLSLAITFVESYLVTRYRRLTFVESYTPYLRYRRRG